MRGQDGASEAWAGQRLLRRDYRPGRGHRRLTAGITAAAGVAVAGASVTAVTLIGSAPPALATVTGALTRTLAQSYHLTDQTSIYTIWNNGRIRDPGRFTCVSEADPVRHLEASTCSDGPPEREVGGREYIYIAHPDYQPDKHWRLVPINRDPGMSSAYHDFTAATPQQMLAQIKKVNKITVIGPASGPGWTGTRYAFSATQDPDVKLSGTVTVDKQGRARALILASRQTTAGNIVTVITETLTFSDFGIPVTVTAPPADQIYDPYSQDQP